MAWFNELFSNTKEKGAFFESLAEKHLIKQGFTPLEKNYNTKFGEIDLIMNDGLTTVFIEVKYRQSKAYGGAKYALSQIKKQRLKNTIELYIKHANLQNKPLRVDFVAINGQNPYQISWYKNVL